MNKSTIIKIKGLRIVFKGLLRRIILLLNRVFSNKFSDNFIAFYGDYFGQNTKYLYRYIKQNYPNMNILWVVKDRDSKKKLLKKGINVRLDYNFFNWFIFRKVGIWVGSGEGGIRNMLRVAHARALKVDLWHGIPFKGQHHDSSFENLMNELDLKCTTSGFMMNYYSKKCKIKENILRVTGYPRNDIFFDENFDKKKVLKKLKIRGFDKIILYAPTWGHNLQDRKKLFFGDTVTLLNDLNNVMLRNNSCFILRVHKYYLNKRLAKKSSWSNIFFVPFEKYSDVQELLCITDVLISDWSSIVNDFILLNRPIMFLDDGRQLFDSYCLQPEDRAGFIVRSNKELLNLLPRLMRNPQLYQIKFREKRERVLDKIHKYKDGNSSKRVWNEIYEKLKFR